jgi:proline iminopeptidase
MLYPEIAPFASGMLDVGQGHSMYWEQCGNPQGQPIVFLHGGPGAGCTPKARRWFNPQHYSIVLLDQRGCGRALPHGRTENNFCQNLVQDLEQLRIHLQIERWLLCGGSWGTTLALAYAQQHRARVQGMVLRGVFTALPQELDWLYKPGGVSQVFPQQWQAFATALGQVEDGQLLQTYAQQLQSADITQVTTAALAWCAWEDALSSIHPDTSTTVPDLQRCLSIARISSHMFAHDPWLGAHSQMWPVDYLQGIPGIIVQGQFDMVTPAQTAWRLHQAWPGSALRIVHEAGHASNDPALGQALVAALDELATMVKHPI